MAKREGSRPLWFKIGICIFAAVFVAGAVIVADTMIAHQKSDSAYSTLRGEVRVEEGTPENSLRMDPPFTLEETQQAELPSVEIRTPEGGESYPDDAPAANETETPSAQGEGEQASQQQSAPVQGNAQPAPIAETTADDAAQSDEVSAANGVAAPSAQAGNAETETQAQEQKLRALKAAVGKYLYIKNWACTMDFAPLKEMNEEIIGWLRNEGTVIDYPLVRAEDNEYYLTHMYNREGNRAGALFCDYRCSGLFVDRNTVIYGHHMNNDSMFGTLEYYESQKYYEKHPEMKLFTPYGDYRVEIFAATVEDGNNEFAVFEFEDEEAFQSYVAGIRKKSEIETPVEIEPGDRIISMITCTYDFKEARFVVYGKLVPVLIEQEAQA